MRRDAASIGTGGGPVILPSLSAGLTCEVRQRDEAGGRQRAVVVTGKVVLGAWLLSVAGGRPKTALQDWRPESSVGEAGQKVSSSLPRQRCEQMTGLWRLSFPSFLPLCLPLP